MRLKRQKYSGGLRWSVTELGIVTENPGFFLSVCFALKWCELYSKIVSPRAPKMAFSRSWGHMYPGSWFPLLKESVICSYCISSAFLSDVTSGVK